MVVFYSVDQGHARLLAQARSGAAACGAAAELEGRSTSAAAPLAARPPAAPAPPAPLSAAFGRTAMLPFESGFIQVANGRRRLSRTPRAAAARYTSQRSAGFTRCCCGAAASAHASLCLSFEGPFKFILTARASHQLELKYFQASPPTGRRMFGIISKPPPEGRSGYVVCITYGLYTILRHVL